MQWLEAWERDLDKIRRRRRGGIDTREMMNVLGGRSSRGELEGWQDFPRRVRTLYRALALDTRALVITQVQAAIASGDRPIPELQRQLAKSLAENTENQDRIRNLMTKLIDEPVTHGLPAKPTATAEAAEMQRMLNRLTTAISFAPDAVPVLARSGRQVLEITADGDKQLEVLAPRDTE